MNKNILKLYFFLLFVPLGMRAQISFDYATGKNLYLAKFHGLGYKYVEVQYSASISLLIYNVDHSLNRTISVPPSFVGSSGSVVISYVTDGLFDLDPGIEYVVNDLSVIPNTLSIYNEDGSLIMYRDSAYFSGGVGGPVSTPNPVRNVENIFFDGIRTKMKLTITTSPTSSEYYNLPGTLPCSDCSQGSLLGIFDPADMDKTALFYPNPASQYLKLKYELPSGAERAFLKVYDLSGKLIQDMEITNAFSYIYLPSEYNNGLYLYTLIVDGKTIKTEKVILSK